MNVQHLSDEAIAAFADGVLTKHARERATRHTASCPECAYAVAVQREAIWALRAAPAPALPSGLFERLQAVPATTPIRTVPVAIEEDGSAMFATFGSLAAAALVPPTATPTTPATGTSRMSHHIRPIVTTAAAVAVAGVLAVSSAAQATNGERSPGIPIRPTSVQNGGVAAPGTNPAIFVDSMWARGLAR